MRVSLIAAALFMAGCANSYDTIGTAGPGLPPGPHLVVLGSDLFGFPGDTETIPVSVPALGRGTNAIGVRPVDGDVRCSRVVAVFANGNARDLPVDPARHLSAGTPYWLDLPGGDRNLRQVSMTCRPIGPRTVDVQLLAVR
jgi:hypothetical protein